MNPFILSLLILLPTFSFADESCSTFPDSSPEPVDRQEGEPPGGRDSDLVVASDGGGVRPYIEWKTFSRTGCAYYEGCVAAPGRRKLLRFTAGFVNEGVQNFHLGNPKDPANAEHVQYDSCHGHYHVKDWAEYELLSASGTTVVRGRKQTFCLRDSRRSFGSAPRKYTCENQGVSVGWSDVYPGSLPCQWIDITGVPRGSYFLQITINPKQRFLERDYTDNQVRVPIRIR